MSPTTPSWPSACAPCATTDAATASSRERLGVNSRLDELQAAVLRLKLRRLDEWNDRRRRAAAAYLEALAELPELEAPAWPAGADPAWHVFALRSDRRDELRAALAGRGIETLIHYPQAVSATALFAGSVAAPQARRAAGRLLSLPLHPHLADGEQDAVVAALRACAP